MSNGNGTPNLPALAEPPAKTPMAVGSRGIVISSLSDLWRFAEAVAQSGLAPKGMERPQAILVAIQMGLELGLSPMAALQNIAVVNGRPGVFGDAAKALVEDSGLLEEISERPGRWCDDCEREADPSGHCPLCKQDLRAADFRGYVCTTKRRGRRHPVTTGFNVRQAKRANLWGKAGPWTQYPNRMLMFRARGFNLRDNFPDVLKGFRTYEELRDYDDARRQRHIQPPAAAPLPPPEAPAETPAEPAPAPAAEAPNTGPAGASAAADESPPETPAGGSGFFPEPEQEPVPPEPAPGPPLTADDQQFAHDSSETRNAILAEGLKFLDYPVTDKLRLEAVAFRERAIDANAEALTLHDEQDVRNFWHRVEARLGLGKPAKAKKG